MGVIPRFRRDDTHNQYKKLRGTRLTHVKVFSAMYHAKGYSSRLVTSLTISASSTKRQAL
ncbi:hypothetical protein HMPREF3214_01071 [Alloscardovia omnicolens]|nr:hypothetical protein HMPREF3214_01071 [Alloscardovia omnicolens]